MTWTLLAKAPFIQFPGGAKWSIGFLGLFHTAVGSLAIGFAFVVTVLQIIGYRRRDRQYDLLAKRVQLWHVCIYNIGTINAIGLVFALSGLYPQFWSQIFVHFFWTLICEELLFFMLATTLTFHYFFWDMMWGHKKLHIFMGAMLTPFFFLQFYIINGMGSFMITPGFAKGQVTQWGGTANILGWDKLAFYNPSFLMLTLHRTAANFAYGAFVAAAVFGAWLYVTKRPRIRAVYERVARVVFLIAFTALLSLPFIGFFYAWVLKYHAKEAFDNLMIGRGDVVAGGIDWWWLKQIIVAGMIGAGVMFYRRMAKLAPREPKAAAGEAGSGGGFGLPMSMVYAIAGLYLMFYIGQGVQMGWFYFWAMLASAVVAGLIATHLLNRHRNSGRAVFVLMGILSFTTVCLGGYIREASRPRFVSQSGRPTPGENRISHYNEIYLQPERQRVGAMRPVATMPAYAKEALGLTAARSVEASVADLISERCISCHTLERLRLYDGSNWPRIVRRMKGYGARLTDEEAARITRHLEAGKPY